MAKRKKHYEVRGAGEGNRVFRHDTYYDALRCAKNMLKESPCVDIVRSGELMRRLEASK